MKLIRRHLRRHRSAIFAFTLLQAFFMTGGAEAVELRQQGHLRAEVESQRLAKSFGIPLDAWHEDPPSWLERSQKVVVEEVDEVFDHSRQELTRWVEKATTLVIGEDSGLSAADVTVSLTQTATSDLASSSAASSSAAPSSVGASSVGASSVGASSVGDPVGTSTTHRYIPKRPALAEGEGERSVASSPFTSQAKAGLTAQASDVLPLHQIARKARTVDASSVAPAQRSNSAFAPASLPSQRSAAQKAAKAIAPEIVALAASLDNAPGKIFRYVHDQIVYDPKWGADSPPLGTLWEGGGTSWDQAWLLQELLIAAGVDARLEWGEVEVPPSLLINLTGIDDPIRAGDFLSTAGLPVVLLVAGSQVIAARFPHVWVKAHVDYIPNRGATAGTADTWIRMDPSLTTFESTDGLRLDQDVPFILADHLNSGTELSPRQDYDAALLAYAADQSLGISSLDDLKTLHTPVVEDFPFVPGTLRAKILSSSGESETLPSAFEQSLEIQLRAEGGGPLLTWNTTAPAIYGQRFEVIWAGATASDQAALDLYGGVFAAPPYEVDLRPTLHLGGVEVASGTSIGSAEDAEIQLTMTPPDGVPTIAGWDLFAGEHGVLSLDFGRLPQQVVDRFSQGAAAATNAFEIEGWQLAQASASYLNTLGGDLDHLSALRWHRLLTLGTAIFGVQRGAVSTSPDGTPQTFSKGPLSLDVGAMPLALFPVDGVQISTVPTLEVLGSQGSFQEGEALEAVFGGEHLTGVTFLTRAVREGQMLTLVDATNVDAALAAADISSDAKSSVRAGIDRGMVAWISENQIESNTFQTTGYILENPTTGSGGYFVTFERRFTPLDGAVTFHNPIDLDVITAPTDVIATIDAEGLESWTLSTRPVGEGATQVIATGTGPVDNTVLGQFDPTLLLNGMHDIVLTGQDAAGQPVTGKITVVVEGKMKIGNFSVSFTDLSVKLAGLALQINRTYDTRDRGDRDFGFGWRLEILQGSYKNNRPPGDGWQIAEGFLPCEVMLETKSHLTTIKLSDIEIYRFKLDLDRGAPTLGGCFAEAGFSFVEGPLPGSTLEILGDTNVFFANASNEVVFPDTQEPFEPQRVRLTTRDGRAFEFDLDQGVQRVLDTNGNFVTITPESIAHSAGHTIDFERDAAGQIEAIIDPMGRSMTYGRDANGDLVTYTDRGGNISRYSYDEDHRLTAIEDPSGNQPIRNEYDDEGRVSRHIDAFGQVITLTHDVDGRREIITNRLGHSSIVEYDERGNTLRDIDPLGNAEVQTFDRRDNLLTETDRLGRTTVKTFSANSETTSITNPLGQTATTTFNDLGRPLVVTDPLGQVTRHTYDDRGNRTRTVDAGGGETLFVYDASGRRVSETDPMSGTRNYVWNAQNRLTKVTDEQGTETTNTYDANGNVLSESTTRMTPSGPEVVTRSFEYDDLDRRVTTTDPDGSITRLAYDRLSRVIRETDELGRSLEREFDEAGRLALIRFPDGTTVSRTYDAEGNLLAETDRDGEVIEHSYDPVGRRIESRFADGSMEISVYDAAGQLVTAIDALGHTYVSEFDQAGRRVKVTDPLGQETLFTHDAAGNVVSTRDANGHITTTEYNAFGLVSRVTTPDGAVIERSYDALRRVSQETDQNSLTTRFEYDGSTDRIAKVTDALGQETVFTYDALGNRLSQTDAKGRTTLFVPDSLGRLLSRTYPDGSTESFSYNPDGTLASRTDFNGGTTTWQYDVNQQESRRIEPDGQEISFTYTAGGDRATVTDARGTTTYAYDGRGRLERLTFPDGRQLEYAYDANGNRRQVEAKIGSQTFLTTYTYDALNRPQTVTDAQGRSYSHSYDANGNRTALTFPNGITTSTTFDSVNRLTRLATEVVGGSTLQSYDFTLDAAGWRQRIDELDGTSRQFTYDDLYRLTEEQVVDGAGTTLTQRLHSYDEVGNRLQQQISAASATTTVDAVFDNRDRLLSRTSGETYAWDANGNLTSRGGAEALAFDWDSQGRLAGMTLQDGTQVLTTYDVDGNRVRTETIPPSGPSQIIDYLVDPGGFLSRVVLESDASGEVLSYYVWGDELLAIVRPGVGETKFVHADGLGSVRLLTDEATSVTDSYTYSAFGELLEHVGDDPNSYLFAGEPLDVASGLYYNRARWLDPSVGRFVSVDPFEGNSSDPLSLHRYLYAKKDPVNRIDPSGEESVVSFNVAAAISTLVAGTLITLHLQSVRSQVAIDLFPVRGLPTLADVNAAFAALAASISLQMAISKTKDNVRRWRKKERGKRKRLLFHYSDKEGACKIFSEGRVNITARGTFGRASYATNIPPVVDLSDLTRSQLVRLLFGDKDFDFRFTKTSHWVAFIAGRDWKNRGVIFYRPVAPPNNSTRIVPLGKGATLLRGDN